MPITIGSNIASLLAQRQIAGSSKALSQVHERLASGQRINHASDDAAGLGIADALRTDTRVLNQGRKNINDGLSALSIAEGATNELKNIILRVRELSTQAANGTYSDEQRLALDTEARALTDEYNRILRSTKFNGRQLFDESQGALVLQAGYGSDGALRVSADETFDLAVRTYGASTDAGGVIGSGGSFSSYMTSDGRYEFFPSSSVLIAGDTNATTDVYRKDLQTGEVTPVSTNSAGVIIAGFSTIGSASADGRYVVMQSWAAYNPGDVDGSSDIYVKDMVTGETKLASSDSQGGQATWGFAGGDISADGRYVVFQGADSALTSGDTNGVVDIFLKDMLTGDVTRISTDSDGNQATGGASTAARITADGRYVVFNSLATNLVAGDTNAGSDVFLKDVVTGETTRISVSTAGTQTNNGSTSDYARITADGQYATFVSTATNLVSGDTNGFSDVFMRNLWTGETSRISLTNSGAQIAGGGAEGHITPDGRYVAFSSWSTDIVSGDTNGARDIFVRDLTTGRAAMISVTNDGSPTNGTGSYYPYISADGRHIAWQTAATNLGYTDTNGTYDVYVSQNPLAERYSLSLLHSVNLRTQNGADVMQEFFDGYLDELNSFQGQLGAAQQRLTVANAVLGGMVENNQAAEGRIRDADIAAESAALIRNGILQQAAAAVLAQANQQSSLALQLLK